MCRPMQTMRFSIVCLPSAKGAHDFRKEVPPPISSVVSKCALRDKKRGTLRFPETLHCIFCFGFSVYYYVKIAVLSKYALYAVTCFENDSKTI